MRRLIALIGLSAAFVSAAPGAQAQGCDTPYIVRSGETIFSIAEAAYGDPEKWTLLYYANEDLLKAQVFQVGPGDEIMVPCEAAEALADATPLRRDDAELRLVTGSNYAPFTDRNWPGGGLLTELVNAAFEAAPDPVSYSVSWEDDWSQHLFPMLDEKQYDMGFPWLRPDCAATPDNERCANFHFSDPLVEVMVLLFKRAGADFEYTEDADIPGKTLCRPAGYFTHDLDRAGREWLSKGLITLIQPDSPQACFDALMLGQADLVSLNVFTGAEIIDELGLRGEVVPLDKPVSVEGLHVVISKTHWRGTTFLYRFNAGLAALKQSDRYSEIVSKHLGIFWDRIKTN